MSTDWKGANLKQIVEAELRPFLGRVSVSGPDIIIDGRMVQTLALVLHELATNAAKYGSLSQDTGHVEVSWSVSGAGSDARFFFRWQESGGPNVVPPLHKGFGSTLLERVVTSELDVIPKLQYEAIGLLYTFDTPLGALNSANQLNSSTRRASS